MAERGGLPWYRMWTEFSRHPKTREVSARVQDRNAGMYVVRLFEHCADLALDGRILAGAVEDIADWRGKPGMLLAALETARVLEVHGDWRVLHDWEQRNGSLIRKALSDAKKPRGNKPISRAGPAPVPPPSPNGPARDSVGVPTESRADPSGVDVRCKKETEDLSERASVFSSTLPPVTQGHEPSRNVTEEAAHDEQHPPAEKPAPALEPGAGTTAASLPPAATPAPAPVSRPQQQPEDERPPPRRGLVLDLTEIPDEEAATAKAELEARLREGYGARYEKALLLGGSKAAEEATRGEWIERVHTLGREAVVASCLDQAAEYWRRTAGHVESLRFFLAGLARVRPPWPAEGAARA